MARENIHKYTDVFPSLGDRKLDEVAADVFKDELRVHRIQFCPWRWVRLGDYVTLRALCDVTLGVGVETGPGDMALEDVGQPFVAWMACKFAAMSMFEDVWNKSRRDDGLQDGQVG